MTIGHGNDIVKDLHERGTGALAPVPGKARQSEPAVATAAKTRPPARSTSSAPGEASDKQRKHTRDQRLVLALARLLASRMR